MTSEAEYELRGYRLWLLAAVGALLVGIALYGFWPIVPGGSADRGTAMPAGPPPAATDEIVDFVETDAQGIDALVVHEGGEQTLVWGDADRPMNTASARKSVLSLLYGIAWDRGLVDLNDTVGELGIDETATPLTKSEKQATIEDLLTARSGVYLQSGGETASIRASRPVRGSAEPGERSASSVRLVQTGHPTVPTTLERETAGVLISVIADDVNQLRAKAFAMGATIVRPLKDQSLGPGHDGTRRH